MVSYKNLLLFLFLFVLIISSLLLYYCNLTIHILEKRSGRSERSNLGECSMLVGWL